VPSRSSRAGRPPIISQEQINGGNFLFPPFFFIKLCAMITIRQKTAHEPVIEADDRLRIIPWTSLK
jgi:hypothetical protein